MPGVQRCELLLPMFDGRLVVCVSLCACLLRITTSCAKTDEPIEMPFSAWNRVSTGNHAGKGQFWVAPCDAAFRRNSLTICY